MDNMDNIVPTPAEFIFLARLYHAHKQGYILGRPTPPPCYKRLSAHGFIDFVSGDSVLNASKQWVFSITDRGIDYFLFWLKTIIVVVGTAVSTVLIA